MDGHGDVKDKKTGLRRRIWKSIVIIKKWTRVERLTTGGLYLHVLAWGVYCGALSSTLLDLQLLTSTSTAQVAFMFTTANVGALVGAPLGGQILARLDNRFVLGIVCCCFGSTIALLPWATNFIQLIAFAAINGLFQGALDTAQNITGLLIWGWDSFVYMQGFHGTFAIGTFIGPWLAKPFLAPTWYEPVFTNSTRNESMAVTPNTGNVTSPTEMKLVLGESKAMYVYMIIGIYLFLSGLVYLIIFAITRKDMKLQREKELQRKLAMKNLEEQSSECRNPNQKNLWYLIPMTIMAFLRFGTYVGLELTFSGFLMTYAVKGLNWEKEEGLVATTTYWGSFAVSRIFSTFVAMCISPTVYVIFDMVLMVIAYVCMAAFVQLHPLVIVLCSIMAGIAQGSFYGCSMSWMSKYMHVTERIGSAFTTGAWVGVAILPALAGYLIDYVSPHAFIYLCLVDAAILATVTGISTAVGLKYGSPIKRKSEAGEACIVRNTPPNGGDFALMSRANSHVHDVDTT